MGTNYYADSEPKPTCPTCGHVDRPVTLHIGKSSGGWRFGFAVETLPDGTVLDDFTKWVSHLAQPGVTITDEYGRKHSLATLLSLIESKQDGLAHGQNHEGYGFRYVDDGHHYQDAQGYDFTRGDFS